MTDTDVEFEDGPHGKSAVVRTQWNDKIAAAIRRERPAQLELNNGKGWSGKNVDFLRDIPWLSAVSILFLATDNDSGIHACTNLRELHLNTYCKNEIRFDTFPDLEVCLINWRPRARSVFKLKKLRQLAIYGYNGHDFDALAPHTKLRELSMLTSPTRDITGLSTLVELRTLALANLSKLESIRGLETLTNLEELDISTCRRFTSLEPIRPLKQLKRLFLNNLGDIESLEPLRDLKQLELLTFYESTNIVDGDMRLLREFPKLKSLSYQNRKHYTHKREEFPAYFSKPD